MGFVETVAGEFVEHVEKLVGLVGLDAVFLRRALDEDRALLGHFLGLLFAHRAAQHVGAAQRVAGENLRGLHDLLLIDHDAVGFLQDRLEQRVIVFGRTLPALRRRRAGSIPSGRGDRAR